MTTRDSVEALANRAADLLPEPPAPRDAFGYLAWEELVLATAERLRTSAVELAPVWTLRLDGRTGKISGSSLLALAGMLSDARPTAAEVALARALDGWRHRDCDRRSAATSRHHDPARRRSGQPRTQHPARALSA